MSNQSKTENALSPSAVRAWVRLVRAQRIVLAAIERDLKAANLPPLGWYDILLELARADDGRLRPYQIEQRVLLAQYNLSRLIDRLERAGLVRREAFGEDGRGLWVVITDTGRVMQAEIWAVYSRAIQDHVADKLDTLDADALAGLLERLIPSP